MALFLRDEVIRETVGMDNMLEAIEDMQRHYGLGECYNLGRRKIIGGSGVLSVMGGGLFYKGVFGVKAYTVISGRYSFQISRMMRPRGSSWPSFRPTGWGSYGLEPQRAWPPDTWPGRMPRSRECLAQGTRPLPSSKGCARRGI